jgi:hypothetical protein
MFHIGGTSDGLLGFSILAETLIERADKINIIGTAAL